MYKEENMEEGKMEAEKITILNTEKGSEKKTDGNAEETKGNSVSQTRQIELLNQLNGKMDALLAANNISL